MPAFTRLSFLKCVLVGLLTLALAGCSMQLHQDLSESEANMIISALKVSGIDASKQAMKDKKWAVSVAESDFAPAVLILRDYNLPPAPFNGLGQVFKREGMLATPTEERARLMHAVSEELMRTIRSFDGVVDARVHVVVPSTEALVDKVQPASASVLVKTLPDFELKDAITDIRALVVNAVEGLDPARVSIVLVPVDARRQLKIAPASGGAPKLFAAGFAGMALTALLIGLAMVVRTRLRAISGQGKATQGPDAADAVRSV
jgi:type III secretion protein J